MTRGKTLKNSAVWLSTPCIRCISYHSPRVQDGATRRQLVDLLGFSADWICLIEAKAMSMLDGSSFRSSDRRKANIEKGITKGLGQLGGALKNIRSGADYFARTATR